MNAFHLLFFSLCTSLWMLSGSLISREIRNPGSAELTKQIHFPVTGFIQVRFLRISRKRYICAAHSIQRAGICT